MLKQKKYYFMIDRKQKLPIWLILVTAFFAILAFIVTSSLIFSPASVLETVDLKAKGVDYLIYMWAARQFSLGFIFAFSLLKKSKEMISLSFLFFLVMNIADVLIGVSQKDNGLMIGALVMCVISSTILYFINKIK